MYTTNAAMSVIGQFPTKIRQYSRKPLLWSDMISEQVNTNIYLFAAHVSGRINKI